MILNHFASALFYVLFGPFLLVKDVTTVSTATGTKTSQVSSENLLAVFTVLRHGDRAPTDFYPLDPFKDASNWAPNGIGELNPSGIERMKETGRLYRDRYRGFLDRVAGWPDYARSSTRNRTIESAKYFLETFLDSAANLSSMITLDQRMLTTSYPCNRASAAWLQWFQSAEVTEYMTSKTDDIRYLGQLTGEDYFDAKPFTLRQLEFLATTTSIERDEYGLNVPEWIRNRSNIDLMDDFKRHAYLFDWRPPIVQKYRVGPLLGDIRKNIQSIISSKKSQNSTQTFFLYSTHDVNQVLLLQALGLYDQIGSWPTTYSSAIVFEVYKEPSEDQKVLIRTLYRQVNRISFWVSSYVLVDQPLNITSCKNSQEVKVVLEDNQTKSVELLCPFEEFMQLIEDKVPLNYEEECAKSSAGPLNHFSTGVVLLIFILSFVLF